MSRLGCVVRRHGSGTMIKSERDGDAANANYKIECGFASWRICRLWIRLDIIARDGGIDGQLLPRMRNSVVRLGSRHETALLVCVPHGRYADHSGIWLMRFLEPGNSKAVQKACGVKRTL